MTGTDNTTPESAIRDRVLVEAEPYGRAPSYRAMVLRVCPTELWLGLLAPDRHIETLAVDHRIRLTRVGAGAAVLGTSRFLRLLDGGRSRVFAVERPAMLEPTQRRRYVRYPVDVPVRFRQLDPATFQPRGRTATTVTRDLSPGGLRFVTDAAINVGDDLDMTLPLSGMDHVSMNGVVKRVDETTDSGGSISRGQGDTTEVAVQFTRITSLNQERIVRLIMVAEQRRRIAAAAEGELAPI
jgi:c-di-GMP-binding flagellar brake protein YcgR